MEKTKIFYTKNCVICCDDSNVLFSPCNHQCCCNGCSETIKSREMDCPLCRTPIQTMGNDLMIYDSCEIVDDGALSIWIDVRESYLEKLHGKCSTRAGYKGRSKMARSVSRVVGDALMEIKMENQGTDRFGAKTSFDVSDSDVLTVSYRPMGSRKNIQETYQLLDKDVMISDLKGFESTTALELATFDPQIFFLLKYHWGSDAQVGMDKVGIPQKKRRRRRK